MSQSPKKPASEIPLVINLETIIAAEPELRKLLAAARQVAHDVRHDCHFCRERAWKYGTGDCPALKPWLMELIGWESRHRGDLLGTSIAWDLMVDEVMRLLPECRRC